MKAFIFSVPYSFFTSRSAGKNGTARPNIFFAIPDRRLENAILIRVKENWAYACWDLSYEVQVKITCDAKRSCECPPNL
jgi:hypothetical protein